MVWVWGILTEACSPLFLATCISCRRLVASPVFWMGLRSREQAASPCEFLAAPGCPRYEANVVHQPLLKAGHFHDTGSSHSSPLFYLTSFLRPVQCCCRKSSGLSSSPAMAIDTTTTKTLRPMLPPTRRLQHSAWSV